MAKSATAAAGKARASNKVKAQSIHIGLNGVDPKHYGGWSGELCACEFDANDMAALAKAAGMTTSYLRAGYADVSSMQLYFGINFYNNHWPISDHFQGSLDEVSAYPVALSDAQVAAMFASGVGGGR